MTLRTFRSVSPVSASFDGGLPNHHTWTHLGRPSRSRLGLTATRDRQHVWLDTPDSEQTWELP